MVSDGIGQKLPVGFTSKVLECEELDDYLSSLLLPQALQTIKYLPFQLPASSIKAVLPFLTLCVSMNKRENTPGCKALGLKLDVRKSSVYYSLTIYAVLKFVLPFLRSHLHWRIHHYRAVSDISISEDSYTPAEQLARQRRKQLQELCLKTMDRGIPLLRLFLLLRCWARINTVPTIPNMEKWLAGFQYGSASSSPHPSEGSSIHVLYAHRRWVQRWLQACVPIIALPLLNSARETRDLLSYWIETTESRFLSKPTVIMSTVIRVYGTIYGTKILDTAQFAIN
eukprot:scaffold783_cov118-Cylindrotheca_fusiformis.AAC.5